jgi:flagellar hook-length control protein FliK
MELMQRDARGLERALQDAGLKTDSGSLSFNLRGHDQQREHARNEHSGNGGAGGVDVVAPEDEISAVEAMVALSRANGGIDVRV